MYDIEILKFCHSTLVTNSDNCVKLAKKYGLSLSAFYKLNPSVHSSCDNLDTGKNYCVKAGSGSSSVVKKASKKTTKKSSSKKETRKKLQTKSTFTYYWIAQEGDYSGGKSVR
jgi:LysM repeat protein